MSSRVLINYFSFRKGAYIRILVHKCKLEKKAKSCFNDYKKKYKYY